MSTWMNEEALSNYGKESLEAEAKHKEHHIRYFERFPISQFNDSSGRVDLNYITDWQTAIFKWP